MVQASIIARNIMVFAVSLLFLTESIYEMFSGIAIAITGVIKPFDDSAWHKPLKSLLKDMLDITSYLNTERQM